MGERASSKGVISFGLLSIPVKFFNATSDERIAFNMLSPDGNKIKQLLSDSTTGELVEYKDCTKGIEYEPNKFLKVTPEDIKNLEVKDKGHLEIKEFVPVNSVNTVNIDKSYYLKPDKGGDKAFRLLAKCLKSENVAGIGKWSTGKDNLVLIKHYNGGIVLHKLFFSNEIRAYEDNCAIMEINEIEELAAKELIQDMFSKKFDSRKYTDQYKENVLNFIEERNPNRISALNKKSKEKGLELFQAIQMSLNKK
jgi:DNA end-binding protein Ku